MKKYKSLASMVTATLLTVSLAGGASAADWTTYQGNDAHDGIITDSVRITALTKDEIKQISLHGNGAVNTSPVMQTLTNGDTYGYVLHNGGAVTGNNGGARLTKVKANNATQVWSKQLTLAAGFQLSSPLLVQGDNPASEADDTVYVGTTGYAQLLKNNELTGTSVSDWTVMGGTSDGEAIVLSGTEDTTLTQSNLTFNTTATNRAALGIWVGNTATPGIEINVTVKVDGVTKVTKAFPATTKAIEDTDNKGNYYYYVNENFAATAGSNVSFEVDVVSGNTNDVKVDYASLYQQTGSLQKVTNLNADSPNNVTVVNGIAGQINTPITTDGTYLYFGTWKGGSSSGTYYQMKISDNSVKTFTPDSYGFYWAGAVKFGDYIVFGSDNGKVYYRSVSDFNGSGGVIDLSEMGDVTAGNVRSTITVQDDALYLTSQGSGKGYLWKITEDQETGDLIYDTHVQLSGTSTSTPVLTSNGNIYVGYYSGFQNGGVNVIDTDGEELAISTIAEVGPVQSPIITYTSGTKDYLYFTTNSSTGAGYSYSFDDVTRDNREVWNTKEAEKNTYSLQGMATSNGYLMFGNDFNRLTIVK
ncbi:MAG: hypothetical protein ABS951_07365 [Solibacillus sp.]